MANKQVIFDLETGGFDKEKHAIIQIGAIAIDFDNLTELDRFQVKVQFLIENATHDALEINSFDAAIWEREAIVPRDAANKFSRWLEDYKSVELLSKKSGRAYNVVQMIGHNADRFDMPFLMAWYKKLDMFCPAYAAALDTVQKAKWWFADRSNLKQPENFKLETLCRYFGIKVEHHDAMGDCVAVLELLRSLRREERSSYAGITKAGDT